MESRLIPLQELGIVSQGITISRYASEEGKVFSVVNVSDLEDLYLEQVQGKAQLIEAEIQRYSLRENDVIIAIRGTLLKSSVITSALEGSLSNQNTVFFRAKSHEIDSLYLAVLLRSNYFQRMPSFRERQSTTTLPAIRISELRTLEIPLPDLHTQYHIAQSFLSIEQAKKAMLSAVEIRQKLSEIALLQALGVQV